MISREELLQELSKTTLTVTFTKKDGTDRTMKCTRSTSVIPTEFHPKNETEVESTDNVRVFDVDLQAWRSFNYSTVKEVL